MVGRGMAGVELDGAPELALRLRPVPVQPELYEGQRGVGLGQVRVDLEGPHGRRPGAGQGLARRKHGVPGRAEQRVAVGQASVRECVRGISLDCPLELL